MSSKAETSRKPRQRLYTLFVHYGLKREDWRFVDGLKIQLNKDFEDRLDGDIDYMKKLLKPYKEWRGFAFLFLDIEWTSLLGGKAYPPARSALIGNSLAELQSILSEKLKRTTPIRIVTAQRLLYFLLHLHENAAKDQKERLWDLLAGGRNSLLYDGSKVVEAIIRIANFGRNSPLFRFDDDVIFYGARVKNQTRKTRIMKETRINIQRLCCAYDTLSLDPMFHYFVFSGGYLKPEIQGSFNLEGSHLSEENLRTVWNGFATRIGQLANVPEFLTPSDKATIIFDSEKVSRFLSTLWQVGADPFHQVISGAGFCLSDSAILDLPPYSNMRENVMWIDDHLKFSLHDELRHLEPLKKVSNETDIPGPSSGRVKGVWFEQCRVPYPGRNPTLSEVKWHFDTYMPRLLRGCIADQWLREDPNLKRNPQNLSSDEKVNHTQGEYANYFIKRLAMDRAESSEYDENDYEIKQRMWTAAKLRLEKIVELWGADAFKGTFLHLFVTGKPQETFEYLAKRQFFTEEFIQGLKEAVGSLPKEPPKSTIDQAPIVIFLNTLIEDFLDYIELVRFWRVFVQSARFLLNTRRDRGDVFWAFPEEYPKRLKKNNRTK